MSLYASVYIDKQVKAGSASPFSLFRKRRGSIGHGYGGSALNVRPMLCDPAPKRVTDLLLSGYTIWLEHFHLRYYTPYPDQKNS